MIVGLVVAPLVADADTAGGPYDQPATVNAPAERGDAVPVAAPPTQPCARVAVVGDSLMDNAGPWLRAALDEVGVVWVVDAEPSRRIPAAVSAPKSGVHAALTIRATWGDADCWVVALGSNDLIFGGGDPATATALIDEMLGAVTPGARVWWVNVNYHRDPRTGFDFRGATAVFNTALAGRAGSDARLAVIDWFADSEANHHWFFDPVHVDRTGSIARAELTVAALPA